MAGYLEGLRVGAQFAQDGFDAYDRERAWQEKLAEGSRERADKLAALEAAKAKQRYEQFESGVKMDQEAGQASYEQALSLRKQKEVERHNLATENISRKSAGNRSLSSTVMTPAQATAALAEIYDRYKVKPGAAVQLSEPDFLRAEELKAIQTPGYKPQAAPAAQPTWWQNMGRALLGGGAPPEAAALSPGARAAMGLRR